MHDAFEHAKGGKLTMPVLALGGDKSFGTAEADTLRFVVMNVSPGIIPDFGHLIMDEHPKPRSRS